MTKQSILDYFSDINQVYNDSTRLDSLSNMIDEMLETAREKENKYDMAIPEFQTESLISRYQNDTMSSVFVTSPTEVIKVGDPLSNSDEIRQAFENGEIYKRDFEDARKMYERLPGEWIPTVIDTGLFERSVCREWKCSNCGEVVKIKYPFCHCGADMRGGKQ